MTTLPAKDGTLFPISELDKVLAQASGSGIVSCLGHDSAKPVGWTIPSTLYLEPGSTKLVGTTFISESTDDQKLIGRLHYAAIAERTLLDFEPHKELFEGTLKEKLSDNYKVLSSTFVSCYDPGILERCYPSLMNKVDRDGLLYLTDLLADFDYKGQGVFADKKSPFAICAHAYFRRSLFRQNNLNFAFLDALMNYVETPGVKLRLRVDSDLIGVAETFVPAMEFEHWRGPHFDNNIRGIKLGVSEHKMDDYNKLFNGIGRTEFWWKIENGEQAFEAEEVKEVPSLGVSGDDYGCRYIHSIYDTQNEVFNHFDGAIRMYNSDLIMHRWDHDIKSAGKQSVYTKLFRIDGKFPLADWKLLLHHYFQGNYLIEEYLSGAKNEPLIEPSFIEEDPKPLLDKLTPVTMDDTDGLRIAVSYLTSKKYSANVIGSLFLDGHETYDDQQLKSVVELDVIEIKKALSRFGQNLIIPSDYQFIDYQDGMHWNIPEIVMTDFNKVNIQLPLLLTAVAKVLKAKDRPEQTIAFTFSWPQPNGLRKIISLLGTSKLMIKWLFDFPDIPLEMDEFSNWLTKQENWMSTFTVKNDYPNLNDVLYSDGTLFIKHHSILKDIVPSSLNFEGNNFCMQLKPEQTELYQLITDKKIAYSSIYHVKDMLCKECGQSYFGCPHSMFLDQTDTNINEFQIIGYYWVKPGNQGVSQFEISKDIP